MKIANDNSFFGKLTTAALSKFTGWISTNGRPSKKSIQDHPKAAKGTAGFHMKNHLPINHPAPDFSLTTPDGRTVRLSDFQGNRNVLLVFNRGFM